MRASEISLIAEAVGAVGEKYPDRTTAQKLRRGRTNFAKIGLADFGRLGG